MNDPQILIEALENIGREWRPYSGRGMMGKQCVSTPIDDLGELFKLGREMANLDCLIAPSFDQLGLGYIVYWPRYRLKEES